MKKVLFIAALFISSSNAYCDEAGCPSIDDGEGGKKHMHCGEITKFDKDGKIIP